MKVSEKLANALNEQFGLKVNADDFHRLYPGPSDREGGAFVWCFSNLRSPGIIGGIFPASDYVKKGVRLTISRLRWGDIEVWPEEAGEGERE